MRKGCTINWSQINNGRFWLLEQSVSEIYATSHTETAEASRENLGAAQEFRLDNNVQFLLPLTSISEFKHL